MIRSSQIKALVFSGVLILMAARVLAADVDYPTKPITIVVPFAPGGASSVAANILLGSLPKYYAKRYPFILDHRPGATGMLGTDYFMKQPADGYNLCWFPGDSWIAMVKQPKNFSFTEKDFKFIMCRFYGAMILAVPTSSPFKTFEDFIEYARQHPAEMTCSTSGIGSTAHLTLEILMEKTGVRLTGVPFPAGTPSALAMLGGHVTCTTQGFGTLSSYLKSGKCRALAVFDTKRDSQFRDVPTAREKGYDIVYVSPQALIAKKGTPQAILDYLTNLFKQVANDSTVQSDLVKTGFTLWDSDMDPQETEKFVNKQFEVIGGLLKRLGLIEK